MEWGEEDRMRWDEMYGNGLMWEWRRGLEGYCGDCDKNIMYLNWKERCWYEVCRESPGKVQVLAFPSENVILQQQPVYYYCYNCRLPAHLFDELILRTDHQQNNRIIRDKTTDEVTLISLSNPNPKLISKSQSHLNLNLACEPTASMKSSWGIKHR